MAKRTAYGVPAATAATGVAPSPLHGAVDESTYSFFERMTYEQLLRARRHSDTYGITAILLFVSGIGLLSFLRNTGVTPFFSIESFAILLLRLGRLAEKDCRELLQSLKPPDESKTTCADSKKKNATGAILQSATLPLKANAEKIKVVNGKLSSHKNISSIVDLFQKFLTGILIPKN